jgi:transcriptional regulator GlxA family with amidase domain
VTDRDGMYVHVTAKGAMVRQLGLADSRLSQISRAVRWIRDHHAEMLRIEDLARVANMSATSFFRHFRAVISLTPIQYQKQVRLQKARAKLLASPGDVAAVGYAVGYDSPSQFSREYRLFGAPPGRDTARLQETSLSASPSRIFSAMRRGVRPTMEIFGIRAVSSKVSVATMSDIRPAYR